MAAQHSEIEDYFAIKRSKGKNGRAKHLFFLSPYKAPTLERGGMLRRHKRRVKDLSEAMRKKGY